MNRLIALLDLNYTLVANSNELRKCSTEHRKRSEQYRKWLVELLERMQATVVLVTIRPIQDKVWTLARIAHQLDGWQPAESYFNDLGYGTTPPNWKRHAVTKKIFPKYGYDPDQYLAVESNLDTHKMYASLGIRGFKVFDTKGEPSVAGSNFSGGQVALFD